MYVVSFLKQVTFDAVRSIHLSCSRWFVPGQFFPNAVVSEPGPARRCFFSSFFYLSIIYPQTRCCVSQSMQKTRFLWAILLYIFFLCRLYLFFFVAMVHNTPEYIPSCVCVSPREISKVHTSVSGVLGLTRSSPISNPIIRPTVPYTTTTSDQMEPTPNRFHVCFPFVGHRAEARAASVPQQAPVQRSEAAVSSTPGRPGSLGDSC